jgi:iron complex outermembrane receptor protein
MRKITILATLGLFSAAWAPPVRAGDEQSSETADDLDLVKLLNVEVSTASKTSESLDDAPAIITVVTQRDIRRWGYQSVAEVLNHTVGFYVIDDHILPNAAVRGMTGGLGAESGVIKVMIDGRSTAYRTTSGNWLGIELISLESIAQIEIIRGPVSALYGADAFLGVINIITVRPEDLQLVRARLGFGMTGAHAGGTFDVVGGKESGHYHLMIGATGESTDRSGLELPAESPAPTLPGDIDRRRSAQNLKRRSLGLQARAGWADDRIGHVTISAFGSGIERGGDFAHWAQLTNETDANGVRRGTTVALGQYRLNLDTLVHLSPTIDFAFAATYSQGGVLPHDRVEIASDLFYVERHTSFRGADGTVELRWLPTARFNLIGGVEGVYDHEHLGAPVRISRSTGEPIQDGASDLNPDLSNLGAFLSSSLKVFDPGLKLTGGVRYDRHSDYGSQVTGRLGVTSRLGKSLVAKLLYGSAFKAPSPYLLYATPLRPGDVIGNPLLRPQKIHTVEFQVGWKPTRIFGVSSGVSYNWLLNKAEFTPRGINQAAQNVAKQRTFTWETRADVGRYDDYAGYAAFELVQSVRDLGQEGYAATLVGSKNVVYPPWIGRLGAYASVPSPRLVPLSAAAEVTVVGPRRAADTSIVEAGADFTLPVYTMLNLSISTRDLYLIRGHETRIALRFRNALQARGPDPGFSGFEYPLAPREIFLQLEHLY